MAAAVYEVLQGEQLMCGGQARPEPSLGRGPQVLPLSKTREASIKNLRISQSIVVGAAAGGASPHGAYASASKTGEGW